MMVDAINMRSCGSYEKVVASYATIKHDCMRVSLCM